MKAPSTAILALLAFAAPQFARAQATYQDSSNPTVLIPSTVQKCLNTSGYAVPVSSGQCASGQQASIGQTGSAGDATIATGGTAQSLFGGATPANGFSVGNPNPADDCWVSDSATAAVNGKGSYRVVANGGEYTTPPAYKPVGAVSVICPTTNDVLTARRW